MKIFRIKFLAFLLVLGFAAACSIDDTEQTCNYYGFMSTESVTGPETVTVNTDAVFTVTFVIANSCGTFTNFNQSNGFPKNVVARVDYVGCDCVNTPTTGTEEYTFKAAEPGEYELRFLTDTDTPITKIITVTAE